MTISTSALRLGRTWILVAVALPILIALWWAFRPERLWINQTVNEAAPFDTSGGPQPILSGRFEGKLTSGRATIYMKPDGGEYLRLTDFTTANVGVVHVGLAQSSDQNLAGYSVDLGMLTGKQGDQTFNVPKTVDLKKYDAVAVYSDQSHRALGLAKLDPF